MRSTAARVNLCVQQPLVLLKQTVNIITHLFTCFCFLVPARCGIGEVPCNCTPYILNVFIWLMCNEKET